MKQLWAVLAISALAQITILQAASAQTPPASAPIDPQTGDKPAILLPNSTTDTQYDLNFGFPDRNGPLSAMLVIIPKAELEEFNQPGGVRHLNRVARAEAGAVLAVKLMVTGIQADTHGIGKVMSDVQILAPSGEIYGKSDYKEMPVFVGPVTKGVYDNRDRVVLLRFESVDAPGIYTVKAVVHDRFAQRDIPLEAKVELLPPRSAVAPVAPPIAAPQPAAVAEPATAAKPAVHAKKRRKHR